MRTVADLREALAEYPDYMPVMVVETSDMGMGDRPSPLELREQQVADYPFVLIGPVQPVITRKYPARITSPED